MQLVAVVVSTRAVGLASEKLFGTDQSSGRSAVRGGKPFWDRGLLLVAATMQFFFFFFFFSAGDCWSEFARDSLKLRNRQVCICVTIGSLVQRRVFPVLGKGR